MKFLSFILSIYFLALNFSPCEDLSVVSDELKTEISQNTNDGHLDFDLCSPFCQCHCCHIHVTHFKVVEYNLSSSLISTKVFHYFEGMESNFSSSLFQPPQV
ncbi:DUF6660 family protein [Halomarinibacterium sedimenti]|uniref:DUF6660 family protein n=1 Tax=Halomarinibacterium sedimenti TaxID=2857106 RepID=UPI00358FF56B